MNWQYKFFPKRKRSYIKIQREMPNKVSNKCMSTFKIKVQQRIFQSCHSHKRKQCHKIHFPRLSLKKSEPKMSRLGGVIHTCVTIPKEQ